MEMDDVTEPSDQWLRVSYDADDEQNVVLVEKVTYERVMREACGASSKPILIYATEAAVAAEPLPLSDALKTFAG